MCELLGICANREVDVRFSFREWRHRGSDNPDGYGFAYWPGGDGGKPRLVKEAASLYDARDADTAEVTGAQTAMFLAHVRLASVGGLHRRNTHPFVSAAGGRHFVFAHNGTVPGVKQRPLLRRPVGQTDSEHAFLHLLDRLEDVVGDPRFVQRLKDVANEVRTHGRFNFLLSDGATLWAHADDSLYVLERRPPYGAELVRMQHEGYAIGLDEVKGPDERAVLVATQPLTDESGWERLAPGEAVVVVGGVIRHRLAG